MRVAIDTTSLLVPRTGIGVFTAELLKSLSSRPDVEVSAFSYGPRGRGWLPDDVAAGVRQVWALGPFGWFLRPGKIFQSGWVAGSADVVHGPNYSVPTSRRKASVVSVHDVSFEHQPPLSISGALAHRKTVRAAIQRGAWVHTDSDYVAQEVRDIYDVDPDRVVTVPLGVSLPPPGSHPAPGSPYILALGSSDRRKDLVTLVIAFDQLAADHRDLRLIHAGPDGDATVELDNAISRSRHRDRIHRLRWVDDPARSALIHGAAAVAYPSIYEGFGLVPLEAMSAGRPVVTTPVSSIPEVSGDAALYAPAGDFEEWATALHQVLTDSTLVADLVAKGRVRAAKYTWDRTTDGLISLYSQAHLAVS